MTISMATIIPFVLGLVEFGMMLLAISKGRENLPFVCVLLLAFFGYVALSAKYFPIIAPPNLTVYEMAVQPLRLRAMLTAVGVTLPVLLASNVLQYWIFRGKTIQSHYGGQ